MSARVSSFALGSALLFAAASARAQSAPAPAAPRHPAVCGAGVRVYHEKSDVPVPHDTVSLPPGPPIRVSSPEEAEAAELAMRDRAGAVGANGVLISDESTEEAGGGVRVHRSVTAVYVPSDSAHAVASCKKS